MTKTYTVYNSVNEDVLEYFKKLKDAKDFVKRKRPKAHILALYGQYFGEGYHMYRLKLENGKFIKW